MDATVSEHQATALRIITEQLSEATSARKCHGCGCFHKSVEALAATDVGTKDLVWLLSEARGKFTSKQYDCLGCPTCYPAIAANAFSEAFPQEGAGMDLCPLEEPQQRSGWPRLPGDYHVVRYNAPVAVCVLNSERLASHLQVMKPDGLAIAGTLCTENLGIERIIQNTLSNPNIRFLILCGEEARQAVGHLPGQSLKSLFDNGIDDRGRIRGAMGRRSVLKNVTPEQVNAFCKQITLVPAIGTEDGDTIARMIQECARRDPGPYQNPLMGNEVLMIKADEQGGLILDPAGYFVVYPDQRKDRLVVEHYSNAGVLDSVIEGNTSGAICSSIIERQLISRLDHAAYVGRELARAERALQTGERFVQDRASGELPSVPEVKPCGWSSSCGDIQ